MHADDPYRLDFSPSLYIPGVLHILHNMTEGLSGSLKDWDKFVKLLTHVSRLLGRKWSRQRVISTCFREWPHSVWAKSIGSFDTVVFEGRWASAVFAASKLLPLRAPLCAAWSLQRYNYGEAGEDDQDGEEEGAERKMQIHVADEAIRSCWFWGYLEMVDAVAQCIQELGNWAESCPCHGGDVSLAAPTRHLRVRLFHQRVGLETCPMRTRRAPEMANWEMMRVLRRLLALVVPELILLPAIQACSEAEKNGIVLDFGCARRHILFHAQLKFGHWRALPWVLAGISHHDLGIAALCARRALDLYATSKPEVKQHFLVDLLCSPASPARLELERFIDRPEDLRLLPNVGIIAAKFRFVTISERYVESLHAQTKKFIRGAPHHSALHHAWSIVHQGVQSLVAKDSSALSQLAQFCQKVKSPRLALAASGMFLHPDVQSFARLNRFNMRELSRLKRPMAVELLFHTDARTLFQDHRVRSLAAPPRPPPPPPPRQDDDNPEAAAADAEAAEAPEGDLPPLPPPLGAPPPSPPPPPPGPAETLGAIPGTFF